MDKNGEIREGFHPRKQKKRALGATRRNFPWQHNPIGRVAKVIIGMIADKTAGSAAEIERDYKAAGVTAAFLYRQLMGILPCIADECLKVRGTPLKPSDVYHRFHKMFYDNTAEREQRGRRSGEHYKSNPYLRPLIPAVDKLLRAGKIITPEQANKVGQLDG